MSSLGRASRLGSSIYSASTTFADKRSIRRSESILSPSRLSESTEEEEQPGSASHTSPTRVNAGPLGPRWNDYSFREADLYYGAPRPTPVERASDEIPRPPAPKPSFRSSSSGLWAKVTGHSGATEQGFQVIRPRPASERGFVVVRPNRPTNLGNDASSGADNGTL